MKEHKSTRGLFLFLVLSLAAILLCLTRGWLSPNKGKTVVTFGMFAGGQWDVPNDDCYKIIDETIEAFEQDHPEVDIQYVSGIQKDDYSEWISQAALNGKLPDVFMVLEQDFEDFAQVGILHGLDTVIEHDTQFDPGEYYKACYEAGKHNGEQYAIPFESNPTLLFVNGTLLKESNISLAHDQLTWNEFYQLCSIMTKDKNDDGQADQFGVYDYRWQNAVYSNGGRIFDEKNNVCMLTGSDVVDSISFAKRIYQISGYRQPTSEDFDLGHVAFRPMRFSEFRTYKPYPYKLNKYGNFDWDCTQLPVGPNENYQNYVDNLLIGINNDTRHLDYAWMFLKELTWNRDTQRKIFSYSQGVSVLKKVTNSHATQEILDKELGDETGVKVSLLNTVMEHAISREKIPGYEEIVDQIDGSIVQLIMYNHHIDDELREIKKKIDKQMEN